MTGTRAVFQRDLKDLRRTKDFRIIAIIFAVLTIGVVVGACIGLSRWEWLGQAPAEITRPALEFIIGLTVYFLTFFALISFIWTFTSNPIIEEKTNGNIEKNVLNPLGRFEISGIWNIILNIEKKSKIKKERKQI